MNNLELILFVQFVEEFPKNTAYLILETTLWEYHDGFIKDFSNKSKETQKD